MRRRAFLLSFVAVIALPAMAHGQQTELRRPPEAELRRPAQAELRRAPEAELRQPPETELRRPPGTELRRPPLQQPTLDSRRDTTPSTYRDPGASAIGAIHEKTGDWATTKVNKKFKNWLKYDAPPGFNTGADRNCFRQHKKLVEAAERLASRGAFQALGIANTLSDSGARVGGHLMEGDIGGAGVALLDEGAKGLSATGAAWAGGTFGAKVGLAIGGPPGSMVGGAVGAVAGAVVATVGYNAFLSPTLTEAVEGAMEPDYVELARRNRAEHLAAEALRNKEKEQAIEQARQNRREFLAEVERLRTEPPHQLRAAPPPHQLRAAPPPHQLRAAPDADPPPPDASRPVIPADCTIIATVWNTEHPEHKAEIVYHIRNNEVTATFNMPKPDHVANWQSRFQFDGTLTDNRIRGTGRWNQSGDSVHQEWVIHFQTQATTEDDIVFHADGTLLATYSGAYKSTHTYRRKPANSTAEDRSNTSRHTATVAGRWKFGGGAKDKAN